MAAEGIAGLALSSISVAALFETCIEYYNIATATRDFVQDYELLCTQLSIQALRLLLWGESVGLAYRESNQQSRPNPGLDDPKIQPLVIRTLNAIKNLLDKTRNFDGKYGYKQEDPASGSVAQGLGIFKGTFDQFKDLARRNQQPKSVTIVTRWTILDAQHFEIEITRLGLFIDGLESITVSIVAIQSQRDRLRKEIETVSDVESLRLLRDLSDPELYGVSDTARRRLASIESPDYTDAKTPIRRNETSVTNQTSVARPKRITEENPEENRSEGSQEWSLAQETSLPIPVYPAEGNFVTSRLGSGSRTGKFSWLKWSKITSSKQPQRTERASRNYEKHNRKNLTQSANNKQVTVTEGPYKLVVSGSRHDRGRWMVTSALTTQFMSHNLPSYDEDSEAFCRKRVIVDGECCRLEILDALGIDEYTALRDHYLKDGEGFVLVYDINDRESFAKVQTYHKQLMRVKDSTPHDPQSQAVVMIVGRNYLENENQELGTFDREVSVQEGQDLARVLGCGFVETSWKDYNNVEKAFYEVVRALRKQRLYVRASIPQQLKDCHRM